MYMYLDDDLTIQLIKSEFRHIVIHGWEEGMK